MEELGRTSPAEAMKVARHPIIVILDDVRSMHNVGSAFRTCDAFAAAAIYLCGYTPTPPHRDIHKTALGATETVVWKHYPTIAEAITSAKQDGYTILVAEQTHNSIPLNAYKWDGNKIAIVFGNEVTGVSNEILKAADACLEIPQWGAKHSLNISVSVGVVLWELVRQ
ncbi:MAG: RNA methyltransferase [Taibaiella sp.]|nr:RNA methyltransferase [Taibaiella sp.]